jgi:superfamily II DNA or RNA helicase
VTCEDRGILYELDDFFSFFSTGYRFSPAFKRRQWDGKRHEFNLRNQTLPSGLLYHLAKYAESRKHELELAPGLELPKLSESDSAASAAIYSATGNDGKPLEIRDYQQDAIDHAIEDKKVLLVSPTGSGKSLIIYQLLRWYLDNLKGSFKKAIVIVPTTALVEQMYKDFSDYSSKDKTFKADEMLHKIYSGQEKDSDAPVIITTWQSAITMGPKWFEQFGAVFGDEAHLFKAASLTKIMSWLKNAWFRIGTTGTLPGGEDAKMNKLVLEGAFGPVYQVTTTAELIDVGTLAELKIHVLVLKYSEALRKQHGDSDYQAELDFLTAYEPRNRFITNLVTDLKGNSLILYQFVEKHGEPLYEMIKKKLQGTKRKVYFVSGEVSADERERIRGLVEKEEGAVIVASVGTFSTGINIRNLHNIVFASPTKSQIRVLQSIGRGLRKTEDERGTTVYDIADDLSKKGVKNYTLEHAIERVKIYTREKFDFEVHEVPIS